MVAGMSIGMHGAGPTVTVGTHAGRFLREVREIAGLSQGQLAARMDVSQPYVSQLEAAPTMGTAALTKALAAVGYRLGFVAYAGDGRDTPAISDLADCSVPGYFGRCTGACQAPGLLEHPESAKAAGARRD
jgi:transcriptional regulator with XRE-family HTH domain